jgi:hypothetical protein
MIQPNIIWPDADIAKLLFMQYGEADWQHH